MLRYWTAMLTEGHLCSLGRTQAEEHFNGLKANGSLLFSPGVLHSPNTLVPTEANAFWYRISGEQEWTELNFEKGKTLHHWNESWCIPKLTVKFI